MLPEYSETVPHEFLNYLSKVCIADSLTTRYRLFFIEVFIQVSSDNSGYIAGY